MLPLFIVFFFLIYAICEVTKYRVFQGFKEERKIYNKPVVYVKFIAIIIVFILLVINRVLPSGVMERSVGLFNSFLYFIIVGILGLVSYRDIKKVRKSSVNN